MLSRPLIHPHFNPPVSSRIQLPLLIFPLPPMLVNNVAHYLPLWASSALIKQSTGTASSHSSSPTKLNFSLPPSSPQSIFFLVVIRAPLPPIPLPSEELWRRCLLHHIRRPTFYPMLTSSSSEHRRDPHLAAAFPSDEIMSSRLPSPPLFVAHLTACLPFFGTFGSRVPLLPNPRGSHVSATSLPCMPHLSQTEPNQR